ncbi:hypothetical protein P4B35_17620 [Pontiellaceae bacterium B12227]|nr:hypothetical protein [Pontiellaceae bacterium B12227]
MKTVGIILVAILITTMSGFSGIMEEECSKWYEQGIASVKKGDLEAAKMSFSMALAYKPQDANATRGLEMTEARLEGATASAPLVLVTPAKVRAEKHAASKGGIRVAVRNHPGVSEVEHDRYDGPSDNEYSVTSLDDKMGAQIDIMYMKRFLGRDGGNEFGAVACGGVFFANAVGEGPGGYEVEMDIVGLTGGGGFVYRPTEALVIELGGTVGLGIADQSDFPGEEEEGAYVSLAVKAGCYYLIGERMELGIEAGYMTFESMSEVEKYSGSTTEVTLSGGGVHGGLVFAVKF